ncbi:protein of unknown function [Cyanobium sp. NIES-981]|nr:protein of unknown function [Cyanobium sp. NIES-981]
MEHGQPGQPGQREGRQQERRMPPLPEDGTSDPGSQLAGESGERRQGSGPTPRLPIRKLGPRARWHWRAGGQLRHGERRQPD